MQSKTSFFNFTLFRKDLTRFWPLWGFVSFVGALFPLALWMNRGQANSTYPITSAEMAELYYQAVSYCLPIISLIYAVLCAMLVWSYLYNSRSVGLMHTLPIRREGLFVTHFLVGMTMMFIPYAITGALCVLVSVLCNGFSLVPLLTTIAAVAGESFFYFASATLVAFITGNVFALPALYLIFHFLASGLDILVSTLAQGFLFGVNSGYSGAVDFLSPTVYLMKNVTIDRAYEYIDRVESYSGYTYQERYLSSVSLDNLWVIGVYALAGVACVILAWLLYRHRRSETAGDVVSVGWMRPVFRFGVAFCAALGGGLLLYLLLWENYHSGETYDAVPLTVCMILAGAIGYYAASMLLEKSFRVFRGNWKGMVLVAVGCIAVCCALRFDVLGVAQRVPEVSQMASVDLTVAGNSYTFYPGQDDDLIEQLRTVHKAIIADEDYIQGYWIGEFESEEDYTSTYVRLYYNLTNGQTVYRSYSPPMTKARIDQEGTYDQLLDTFVNSQEMKARRLHEGDDRYTIDGGDLYIDNHNTGYDLNSQQAAAIAEAITWDRENGTWGTYDWFDDYDEDRYALGLELSYLYQRTEDSVGYDWIYIYVRPAMTNTVACLKDLGLVTDEDLVTYAERDLEDTQETAGVVTTTYAEPDTFGVIGGADGPTEVLVTAVG